MGLDDNRESDIGFTWEETMRLRGYSEEYIEAAKKRRAERAMADFD